MVFLTSFERVPGKGDLFPIEWGCSLEELGSVVGGGFSFDPVPCAETVPGSGVDWDHVDDGLLYD